jgi:hypothetical protein
MLILACSRRKRPDEGLLPAIERYDGPAFRVLRRFLREMPALHEAREALFEAFDSRGGRGALTNGPTRFSCSLC